MFCLTYDIAKGPSPSLCLLSFILFLKFFNEWIRVPYTKHPSEVDSHKNTVVYS